MTETYPVPLDDVALGATWAAAWSSLGRQAPAGLQAELMTAWSEPQRHYHDQRHLRECLALWTRWRDDGVRVGEGFSCTQCKQALPSPPAPRSIEAHAPAQRQVAAIDLSSDAFDEP